MSMHIYSDEKTALITWQRDYKQVLMCFLLAFTLWIMCGSRVYAELAPLPDVTPAPPAIDTPAITAPVTHDSQQSATSPEKSYQLYAKDIEAAISTALVQAGAGEKISAQVVGRRSLPLYESEAAVSVQIKTLRFDDKATSWSANLLFMNGKGEVQSAMPVSGRYQEMVEIPVLRLAVNANDVIKESDVATMDYPLSRTRKDMVLDKTTLIGKSPRRVISANRPIREEEIAPPKVVRKDEMVRIRYASGPLIIETNGQALDAGSVGDIVRVRNIDTKKLVQAKVEDKGMVRALASPADITPASVAPSAPPPPSSEIVKEKTHETE